MLNAMIEESIQMFNYPDTALKTFERHEKRLTSAVSQALRSRLDILELTGGCPDDVLRRQLQGHADFLRNILKFRQNRLLLHTMPWVYHAYASRGFSYDYFKVEMESWTQLMRETCGDDIEPIVKVFDQLVDWHDAFSKISRQGKIELFRPETPWNEDLTWLTDKLLGGAHDEIYEYFVERYDFPKDTGYVYTKLLQPALYKVGVHWENAQITEAYEHLAATTAARVMAMIQLGHEGPLRMKGDVVVATSSNEHHQIGARMVADLLEQAGWNVRYLGSDLPVNAITLLLDQINPSFVAFSVTLVSNIEKAVEFVDFIRSKPRWDHIRIMIGGLALNTEPGLHSVIGADAYPRDAVESCRVAEAWLTDRN